MVAPGSDQKAFESEAKRTVIPCWEKKRGFFPKRSTARSKRSRPLRVSQIPMANMPSSRATMPSLHSS